MSVEAFLAERNDARLTDVIKRIRSTLSYESLYLHGSFARGDQKPKSDIDLVILMKLPLLLYQLPRIRKLWKALRYNLDIKIISTPALSKPSFRLVMWFQDAVLLDGKNILDPNNSSPRMKWHTYDNSDIVRDFLSSIVNLFLGHTTFAGSEVLVPKEDLEKLGHLMLQHSDILGSSLGYWRSIGIKVLKETAEPSPDTKEISRLLFDYFDFAKKAIKYSFLEVLPYTLIVLIEERKFSSRALLKRMPVQKRFVDSLLFLLHSLEDSPPDRTEILNGLNLLEDYLMQPVSRKDDSYSLASQLREILIKNWRIVMRMPMGRFVLTNPSRSFKVIIF